MPDSIQEITVQVDLKFFFKISQKIQFHKFGIKSVSLHLKISTPGSKNSKRDSTSSNNGLRKENLNNSGSMDSFFLKDFLLPYFKISAENIWLQLNKSVLESTLFPIFQKK